MKQSRIITGKRPSPRHLLSRSVLSPIKIVKDRMCLSNRSPLKDCKSKKAKISMSKKATTSVESQT